MVCVLDPYAKTIADIKLKVFAISMREAELSYAP